MCFSTARLVCPSCAETPFAFADITARRMAWGDWLFESRVRGNGSVKINGIGSNTADGSAAALALTSESVNLRAIRALDFGHVFRM